MYGHQGDVVEVFRDFFTRVSHTRRGAASNAWYATSAKLRVVWPVHGSLKPISPGVVHRLRRSESGLHVVIVVAHRVWSLAEMDTIEWTIVFTVRCYRATPVLRILVFRVGCKFQAPWLVRGAVFPTKVCLPSHATLLPSKLLVGDTDDAFIF